jgi:hypothetical protein
MSMGRGGLGCVAAIVVALWAAGGGAARAQSVETTSIDQADCGRPAPADPRAVNDPDLGIQQCPAPAGLRLLFVSSQENSWLELWTDRCLWSAEDAVVYQHRIGQHPSVDGAFPVHWQKDARGEVAAMLFRVTALDPDFRPISRYFAVGLGATPCLIGRVATYEKAQALAAAPARCIETSQRCGGGR